MCRRSLNHFSWINIVPCGVVDVNVNFDTWITWQRQMCGWLFLRQNVRLVNLSITHDYLVLSLSFNVSRKFELKLGINDVKSRPWFSPVWWYRCTKFEIPSKHDAAKNIFFWINFNIITRNYCMNKTFLIFTVAFLLSDSICYKQIIASNRHIPYPDIQLSIYYLTYSKTGNPWFEVRLFDIPSRVSMSIQRSVKTK